MRHNYSNWMTAAREAAINQNQRNQELPVKLIFNVSPIRYVGVLFPWNTNLFRNSSNSILFELFHNMTMKRVNRNRKIHFKCEKIEHEYIYSNCRKKYRTGVRVRRRKQRQKLDDIVIFTIISLIAVVLCTSGT